MEDKIREFCETNNRLQFLGGQSWPWQTHQINHSLFTGRKKALTLVRRSRKNSGSATGDRTQGLWFCAPVLWPRSYYAAAANRAEYSTPRRLPMSALHSFFRLVCWEWINWSINSVRISVLMWYIMVSLYSESVLDGSTPLMDCHVVSFFTGQVVGAV